MRLQISAFSEPSAELVVIALQAKQVPEEKRYRCGVRDFGTVNR
jgi:hypothetical protein